MPDDQREVRSVSWRDLFPWLILFRAFGVSISLPVLFLAIMGTLLTPLGWQAGNWIFKDAISANPALRRLASENVQSPWLESMIGDVTGPDRHAWRPKFLHSSRDPLSVFHDFTAPFGRLFNIELTTVEFAYHLFGGLWTLLVWALFGGAIARIAAMRIGREERVTLKESLSFSSRKIVHFFGAPLGPLLLAALFGVPVVLVALLLRIPPESAGGIATLLVGVAWIFVLLASFLMAVLLLGLLFGWPLIWGAISAEGTDALDALSRSYAYTFQRPLHYLGYVFLATVLGAMGWALVSTMAEKVIELSYWTASWGAGSKNIDELQQLVQSGDADQTFVWAGAGLIGFTIMLVRLIAVAFSYSFFWCSATTIYLLLRRDVDHAEIDEIYIEETEERYGLPELTVDNSGVPGVDDPPPSASPEPSAEESSPGDQAESPEES